MMLPYQVKARTRALLRCESGTSLVEFAIVLPFLALLLLGLIDFGRYTYDGILAANAARAAVQYGAQNLQKAADVPGMKAAAVADAGSLSGLTVTPNGYCSVSGSNGLCTTSGAVAYVQATATGLFYPLIKYPGLPSQVSVTGYALMRVENQ
jgi:Flp pilus assembly protein TadG